MARKATQVLAVAIVALGVLTGLALAGTGHVRRTRPRVSVTSTKPPHAKHTTKGPDAPSTGRATLSPKDTYAYWTRERMRSARPPHAGIPGGSPPSAPPSGSGGAAPGSAPGSP